MKTKSEITYEYLQVIDNVDKKIEKYDEYLSKKYTEVEELSTGNRGIEEILEEIANMQTKVISLRSENGLAKSAIRANEYNY